MGQKELELRILALEEQMAFLYGLLGRIKDEAISTREKMNWSIEELGEKLEELDNE